MLVEGYFDFAQLFQSQAAPAVASCGTALTLQLALGFLLTTVTIRLIPALVDGIGWRWAFAVLALGPAVGVIAMIRLRAGSVTEGRER